jgi:hypothetical protein
MANIRKAAHEKLDCWIDELSPLLTEEKPPTLMEVSTRITETRSTLTGGVLDSINKEIHKHLLTQKQSHCPKCKKILMRKRVDNKNYNTLQGSGSIERPYYHCRDCGIGFHPLDEAMELTRSVHQLDIEEKVLKLATEMPYKRAAELVSDISGIPVSLSNHHGHDTLCDVSGIADLDIVVPSQEEIEQRIEEASQYYPKEKPVLVVALDGAYTPTRPRSNRKGKRGAGEWKEVKGVRLYLPIEKGRIIQIASWHQIQNKDQMLADIKEIAKLIPTEKVRIALLGDGASWVWNTLTECFPDGKEVLDYFHCKEHIHKVAEAHYDDPVKMEQWVESAMARLSLNEVDSVIRGLQRFKSNPLESDELDKLITYLSNHRGRFDYDRCKREGIPIGSGAIESANKFISHIRLKRSGAWWVVENGNGMLRLRCALYNGTFDRVFDRYRTKKIRQMETNG